MSKNVVFIADYFAEHISGGGELNNEELIGLLKSEGLKVLKKQSHQVDLDFLNNNSDAFFIISNFINLTASCKDLLRKRLTYLIYEHDHKYLASRNPASYENFTAPPSEIRNYFFYRKAQNIICQSEFHKEILKKNMQLDNVISVGGNLWSLDALKRLRAMAEQPKEDKCSVMNSNIAHKNTAKAQRYCDTNGLSYELVSDPDPIKFLEKLGRNKTFVFLPGTPETLSRVVVEARMMGLSIKTNQLVGATSESWFELKGPQLIDHMVSKRDEILSLFLAIITDAAQRPEPKKISIISSFYTAEEYLEGFLQNMVEQTIFDDCELIIIDTGSPGREQEMVKPYLEKYDNIVYKRYADRTSSTEGYNIALKMANAQYATFAFLDDRKSPDCLEVLLSELQQNSDISLTYGDCFCTTTKNETFEETKSTKLMEHSVKEFSPQNMIKCLPGPMPMWDTRMNEECGFLDNEQCKFADDWDLYLRFVNSGFKFKKVDRPVGLYLEGGRSQQANNTQQRQEEATLFYRYAHLFGDNYTKYESYFRQFKR